jgi:hypothetical protein
MNTARPTDILLTESYRSNHFHMSGRARLWFYSQWDERPRFASEGMINWAWQYARDSDTGEIGRREALLKQFFSTNAPPAFRLGLLRNEGITLVHSFQPIEGIEGLRLIASDPKGGFLYRFIGVEG